MTTEPFNLDGMRLIVTIVAEGGPSRAAAALGMTQSCSRQPTGGDPTANALCDFIREAAVSSAKWPAGGAWQDIRIKASTLAPCDIARCGTAYDPAPKDRAVRWR